LLLASCDVLVRGGERGLVAVRRIFLVDAYGLPWVAAVPFQLDATWYGLQALAELPLSGVVVVLGSCQRSLGGDQSITSCIHRFERVLFVLFFLSAILRRGDRDRQEKTREDSAANGKVTNESPAPG
jgi:hypothetical protein